MTSSADCSIGNIYESLDARTEGQAFMIVSLGSKRALSVLVEADGDKWVGHHKKRRRFKIRSLIPEAKLYRLIGHEPLPADKWGTHLSAQISYVSGAAVQKWREGKGLGTREFSILVGCTQRAVQKWESGQNEVPRVLVSFLELLDACDPDARLQFMQQRGLGAVL